MHYTIALVEDNPNDRQHLQALIGEKYDLIEYEDGMSALDGLAVLRPDLVLLDVSLSAPESSEVITRIRCDETLAALPVIALTPFAMAGERVRLMALGFDDSVAKPIVESSQIVGAIKRCLAPSSERRRSPSTPMEGTFAVAGT